MQIYVGNMNYRTTEDMINELFSAYGEVESVKLISDRETGRAKGFGFVTMNDDAAGKEAIEALNEKEFDGRSLRINEARPREERPRRQFQSPSPYIKGTLLQYIFQLSLVLTRNFKFYFNDTLLVIYTKVLPSFF